MAYKAFDLEVDLRRFWKEVVDDDLTCLHSCASDAVDCKNGAD